MEEYKNEWIVTDPNCNQRYRQISKFVFEFEEDRILDPVTKETYLYTDEVDLECYTLDEIIDCCSSFGYPKDEVLGWITNGRNLALIAECIFEMST